MVHMQQKLIDVEFKINGYSFGRSISFLSIFLFSLSKAEVYLPFCYSKVPFRWSIVDLVLLVKPSKGFKLSKGTRALSLLKYFFSIRKNIEDQQIKTS